MSTTLQAAPAVDAYVNLFREAEAAHGGTDRPEVAVLRRAAIERFARVGFPTERNEDWKFTNLRPFTQTTFALPNEGGRGEPQIATTARSLRQGDRSGVRLSCLNGDAPFLIAGARPLPEGVVVTGLAEALESHPERVLAHLGRHADFQNQPFVALNTAFWRGGAFVYVPTGVVVEEPIYLERGSLAADGQPPFLWHHRVLLVLGRGSQATVVEDFSGMPGTYATNTVTEVVLAEGAHLDHYKVQQESPQAFHFACTQAGLARDSRFSTHYVGLGGQLVRNEVRVAFTGQGAEAVVNGLYRLAGTQHADNHTVIDHAVPHCASHELYKGVLGDRSRGVFNGKIFVRLDAQKTDAKQTNQTLLLSPDATINTKPQLEIFADDVKCTHGATVGQLDAEQLFYLRSRGVGLAEARDLLTFAFANDIINRVRVPALRERLEQAYLAASNLPALEPFEEER
jgi:Fe-S cluster assembly protein SufD